MSLFEAAKTNKVEYIRLLLSQRANVNARDKFGQTMLHHAAASNQDDSHFQAIEVLLKHGADVNAQTYEFGSTPLHFSVDGRNAESVRLLLDHGADLGIRNTFDGPPLFVAIGKKDVEIVQLLLDRGADVNGVNPNNRDTPMHEACYWNSLEIVKCLAKNGADLETNVNGRGFTPVTHFFFNEIHSERVLGFFLKYSDVNEIHRRDKNILDIEQKPSVKKMILEHLAKLQALKLPVDSSFYEIIYKNPEYDGYFEACVEELSLASKTRVKNSWITFLNMLVDSKKKFKNYTRIRELMKDFLSSGYSKKFPIYGALMLRNVEKGMKRRNLFEESSMVFSDCLPVFNPNHVIVRNILDCLSSKDLLKFSNQ